MKLRPLAVSVLFALPLAAASAQAAPPETGPDVRDTRMLAQPALSRDHVAFVYASAVWVADPDGRNARRRSHGPLHPALHRCRRRRSRAAARDSPRGAGRLLARRKANRLQPGRAG